MMQPLLIWVIPPRLERGTYCLEGSCSIQLSYGTDLVLLKSGAKLRGLIGFSKKKGEYLLLCCTFVPICSKSI